MKAIDTIKSICVDMKAEADKYGHSKISRLYRDTAKRIEDEIGIVQLTYACVSASDRSQRGELAFIKAKRLYKILRKLRLMPK